MNELVFLEPNSMNSEPFTTSKVISDFTGIGHDKLKVSIRKHEKELEVFGKLSRSYGGESTGGRKAENYILSEPQATFLITLLKNTEIVLEFKLKLVKQFYQMRSELQNRKIAREILKPIRRELTDVIKELPDTNHWVYKKYTDLSYKGVMGKNAKQIRAERGAPEKAKAVEYMSTEEIAKVTKLQNQLTTLIELGMDYNEIKTIVFARALLKDGLKL